MRSRTASTAVDVRRRGPATTSTTRRPGPCHGRRRPRPAPAAPSRSARPAPAPRSPRRRPTSRRVSRSGSARTSTTSTRSVASTPANQALPGARTDRLGHPHTLPTPADPRRSAPSCVCREPVGLSPRSSVRVRDAHGAPVKTGGRAVRTWLSGRASPCQGEGRGFESRRPLGGRHPDRLASRSGLRSQGGVAERRGSGLQSRIRGFESHLHLVGHQQCVVPRTYPRAIGAAVARFPDTEEVTGSIPVSPTIITAGQRAVSESSETALSHAYANCCTPTRSPVGVRGDPIDTGGHSGTPLVMWPVPWLDLRDRTLRRRRQSPRGAPHTARVASGTPS